MTFQPNFDNQRGSLRYQDNDYPLAEYTVVLVTTCFYWSTIESGLALVAACLPACLPTIHHLFVRASADSAKRSDALVPSGRAFSQRKETQSSKTHLANMVRGQPQPAQVEAYAMGAVEPKRTHGQNRISQRASTIRTPHSCVEGTRRSQDHPQALGQV